MMPTDDFGQDIIIINEMAWPCARRMSTDSTCGNATTRAASAMLDVK